MFAQTAGEAKSSHQGGAKTGTPLPYVGMRAITYREQLVAVVTGTSVHLAPHVSELPTGHPQLRLVAALCLYSRDVDEGQVPAPYQDWAAELYARCLLIPDEEFRRLAHEADEELARRFSIPMEQVREKRRDLRDVSRGHLREGSQPVSERGQRPRSGTHRDGRAYAHATQLTLTDPDLAEGRQSRRAALGLRLMDPRVETPSPLLRPSDVARRLGVSTSWLYEAAKDGRIPSVRLGRPDGPLRFVEADLTAWLERARAGWRPGESPTATLRRVRS
jgi:excisionase family DNA binding protein